MKTSTVFVAALLLGLAAAGGLHAAAGVIDDHCAGLENITEIPLKAELPVHDPFFIAIRANRERAKHCLLQRTTDTTPMADPRGEPTKVDGFVVGDLAFFLLADFGYVDFDEVLPKDVREQLDTRGVFAYFDWVKQPGKREELKARCTEAMGESMASHRN